MSIDYDDDDRVERKMIRKSTRTFADVSLAPQAPPFVGIKALIILYRKRQFPPPPAAAWTVYRGQDGPKASTVTYPADA